MFTWTWPKFFVIVSLFGVALFLLAVYSRAIFSGLSWMIWKYFVIRAEGKGTLVLCAHCSLPMAPYEVRLYYNGQPIHDRPHRVEEHPEKVTCPGPKKKEEEDRYGEYGDIGVESAWPGLRQEDLLGSKYFKKVPPKLIH